MEVGVVPGVVVVQEEVVKEHPVLMGQLIAAAVVGQVA